MLGRERLDKGPVLGRIQGRDIVQGRGHTQRGIALGIDVERRGQKAGPVQGQRGREAKRTVLLHKADGFAAGIEDVDPVRVGGLRIGQVGAEVPGLTKRGIFAADNFPARRLIRLGEGLDHLMPGGIIRGQGVDLLHALCDQPRPHGAVDLGVRERHPGDIGRAGFPGGVIIASIGDDQRHFRAVDKITQGAEHAR